MKENVKTAAAFTLLGILILLGFIWERIDRKTDVYPGADTIIRLYGEAHGSGEYYEIELGLWKDCYAAGDRALFVELPYYSAEFLNLWMRGGGEDLLDRFFEEIRGTLSGNEDYKTFFRKIRESCPETVFFGTDVGHQFDTTGSRYLNYLEQNGLSDSENYKLAEECIRQGREYYASERTPAGISPVREAYMISNFISAYERSGGGKIMGIYGSYHIDTGNPELMAGALKEHYGDVISSVRLSTLACERDPYKPGFCVTGAVFLLMLFIPNILWGMKKKPEGYEEAAAKENRALLLLERAGETGTTVTLLIFPCFDLLVKKLPEGLFFGSRMPFWVLAFALMILYECYWIRYFRSAGTMKDFYASFAGFPVAGATLPVLAVLLLGIYSRNLIMIGIAVILGIGHIGIHLSHLREIR